MLLANPLRVQNSISERLCVFCSADSFCDNRDGFIYQKIDLPFLNPNLRSNIASAVN